MKNFFLFLSLITSVSAFAVVECMGNKGAETINVAVIDSFVDKVAIIKRTHPRISIPTKNFPVRMQEEGLFLDFLNNDERFLLSVDGNLSTRSLPPIFPGVMILDDAGIVLNCVID